MLFSNLRHTHIAPATLPHVLLPTYFYQVNLPILLTKMGFKHPITTVYQKNSSILPQMKTPFENQHRTIQSGHLHTTQHPPPVSGRVGSTGSLWGIRASWSHQVTGNHRAIPLRSSPACPPYPMHSGVQGREVRAPWSRRHG